MIVGDETRRVADVASEAVDEAGHERTLEQVDDVHLELEVPACRREVVEERLGLLEIETAIVRVREVVDYLFKHICKS